MWILLISEKWISQKGVGAEGQTKWINQTLSILLGIQFRQRYRQIKDRRPTFFLNIFGLADPETRGVQELILSLFKVHLWLTSGWKSVRFWWYSHTFHDNGDGVLLKAPTKTVLEAILFKYLLTNRGSVYEEEVSQKKMKWLNFLKLLLFEFFR